ncbi:MAG: ATP-binding protein [Treponema sp.]|jgi:hypothetical protein|nr:ATP-binding protein [Treponema sp.]
MSKIIIPERFKPKLPDGSFIYILIKNVSGFLVSAPYFPEYTLHNEDHINSVLEFADELIPCTTLEKLKPQSIEVLIGAIVLHDLGMFIKRAGLKRLVFGEHKKRYVVHLDKFTWHDAWRDFYNKARRYEDRQLVHLFGDNDPIERLPMDDVPEEDTKRQRLIYGEFLRQNHPRIAFDIAQIGFPIDGTDYNIFENCDCDMAKKTMIGLVARSHGMKLRDTESFWKYYELRPPSVDDIPIYYLMAVLRMADYLHVGKKRASKLMELVDEMHSPESKRQFHLNQSIHGEPSIDHKRKEVSIIANPDRGSIYKNVEDLLFDIDHELDICWAVLAEKYRYDYELSIHRIVSNLFDEHQVVTFNTRFLTHVATLGANPDIVKLLVAPLYGNDPSFGVRELIQNAVDACKERTESDGTPGEIEIKVDTENKTFEIIDNGIGMNEDILRNYYLIAGASYRDSETWRENYVNDEGEAKIARSGRFGIGALAGFLIGDEITVITRHKDDEYGFQFIYDMKPKILDVKRVNTNVGTRIMINNINVQSLKCFHDRYYGDTGWYNWYYFEEPRIHYFLNEKK